MWTDTLQVIVMVVAVIVVTSLGTFQLGGPSEIWRKADESGRIQFFK